MREREREGRSGGMVDVVKKEEEERVVEVEIRNLRKVVGCHAQLGQWEAARAAALNLLEAEKRASHARGEEREASARARVCAALAALVDVVAAGSAVRMDGSDEDVLCAASTARRAVLLHREFAAPLRFDGNGSAAATTTPTTSAELRPEAAQESEALLLIAMIGRPHLSELTETVSVTTELAMDLHMTDSALRENAHTEALRSFFAASLLGWDDDSAAAGCSSGGAEGAYDDVNEMVPHLRWLASTQIRLFDSLRRAVVRRGGCAGTSTVDTSRRAVADYKGNVLHAFETAAIDALEKTIEQFDSDDDDGRESVGDEENQEHEKDVSAIEGKVLLMLAYVAPMMRGANEERRMAAIAKLLKRGGSVRRRTMEVVFSEGGSESLLAAVEGVESDACVERLCAGEARGNAASLRMSQQYSGTASSSATLCRSADGNGDDDGAETMTGGSHDTNLSYFFIDRVPDLDPDTLLECCGPSDEALRLHLSRILRVPMACVFALAAKTLARKSRADDALRLLRDSYPEVTGIVALMAWDEMRSEAFEVKWSLRSLLRHAVHGPGRRDGSCPTVMACAELLYRMEKCYEMAVYIDDPLPSRRRRGNRGSNDDAVDVQNGGGNDGGRRRRVARRIDEEHRFRMSAKIFERLESQKPMKVVSKFLPHLPSRLATDIVGKWPCAPWASMSTGTADAARRDAELLHMATVVSITANAFAEFSMTAMRDSDTPPSTLTWNKAFSAQFRAIEHHLAGVTGVFRKVWLINFLVHMISVDSAAFKKEAIRPVYKDGEGAREEAQETASVLSSSGIEREEGASDQKDSGDGPGLLFISHLLRAIRAAYTSVDFNDAPHEGREDECPSDPADHAKGTLTERGRTLKVWIEESEWKLGLLRRLSSGGDVFAPISESALDGCMMGQSFRDLDLKATLTLMRASPFALTIVCLRNERLDLASEVVERHNVSRIDTAIADAGAASISRLVDASVARAAIEGQLALLKDDHEKLEASSSLFRQAEMALSKLERAAIYLDFATVLSTSDTVCTLLVAKARDLLEAHKSNTAEEDDIATQTIRELHDVYATLCTSLEILCGRRNHQTQSNQSQPRRSQQCRFISSVISDVERLPKESEGGVTSRSIRLSIGNEKEMSGSIVKRPVNSFSRMSACSPHFVLNAYDECRNLRALNVLDEVVAEKSMPQFVPGVLHNLAHALEDVGDSSPTSVSSSAPTLWSVLHEDSQHSFEELPPVLSPTAINARRHGSSGADSDTIAAPLSPFMGSKSLSLHHLSRMLRYIADLGEIVSSIEGSMDGFNHLKVLEKEPHSILAYAVFDKGNFQAAIKAADVMKTDLLQAVLPLFIEPIRPPLHDDGSLMDSVHARAGHERILTKQSALQLIRHLAAQSPLRALLACSFGLLPSALDDGRGTEKQIEEQILSFTLEQSGRYPVLHRWIQVQSESYAMQASVVDAGRRGSSFTDDDDDSSDRDENEHDMTDRNAVDDDVEERMRRGGDTFARPRSSFPPEPADSVSATEMTLTTTSTKETLLPMLHPEYMALWGDTDAYIAQAYALAANGKLKDALDIADEWIPDGAPDDLLTCIIDEESSVEMQEVSRMMPVSWTCCMRLRDPVLAARYILLYHGRWSFSGALEALEHAMTNLCACGVSGPAEEDPSGDGDDLKLASIVGTRLKLLRRYGLLRSSNKGTDWFRTAARWDKYHIDFAQELAEFGFFEEAMNVLRERGRSADERRTLIVVHLRRLLREGFLHTGEISRIIATIPTAEAWDAVRILLQETRSRRLRLFLISTIESTVSSDDKSSNAAVVEAIRRARTGYQVLAMLPTSWAQRTSSLAEHPERIVEMLLMGQQILTAKRLLSKFPMLRDDAVILQYVEKAVMVVRTPVEEPIAVGSGNDDAQGERSDETAFSDNAGSATNGEYDRLSSRFESATESVVRGGLLPDLPCLTGNLIVDKRIRSRHVFAMTPNTSLAIALLELIPDAACASSFVVSLCKKLALSLCAEELPESFSDDQLQTANAVCDSILALLTWSRNKATTTTSSSAQDSVDEASSSSSSSMAAAVTESEEVGQIENDTGKSETAPDVDTAEHLRRQVDLISILLKAGIRATIENVESHEKVRKLQERLAEEEYYNLAIFVGIRSGVGSDDVSWLWKKWGVESLRIGAWSAARTRIARSLASVEDANVVEAIVREAVSAIEEGDTVSLPDLRQEYADVIREHGANRTTTMSKVGWLLSQLDLLSTASPRADPARDSALMQRSRERRKIKYDECCFYIRKYCPRLVLEFAVRNGEIGDAVLSVSDLAASCGGDEKSIIDELCSHCISSGTGQELLHAFCQLPSEAMMERYTKLACEYLARNGHIALLYEYQMSLTDFHSAALSCLQLYWNSETSERAVQYLENAHKLLDVALAANTRRRSSALPSGSGGIVVPNGGARRNSASDSAILRLSARVQLQMEILRADELRAEPLTVLNILGSDGHSAKERRRRVAQMVTRFDFDLAFRIISEFKLSSIDVFGAAADEAVTLNNVGDVVELLQNIRGIVTEEERDAIIERCISLYIPKDSQESMVSFGFQRFTSSQWQSAVYRVVSAKRLASMLSTPRRRVMGMIACGDLKSAFDIATGTGSAEDVQLVGQEAAYAENDAVIQAVAKWCSEER